MNRKKMAGLLCICTCALLSGCQEAEKTEKTLTVCADGNGLAESMLGPIFAEFESQNPDVKLEVEYLPPVNTMDSSMMEKRTSALAKARTELMSGKGADIYLFLNNVSSDPENFIMFPDLEKQVMGGAFHDLDFLSEAEGFDAAEYVSPLLEAGVYDGKAYVLPLSYKVPALIALTEPLRESGFDEETAETDTASYVEELLALEEAQRPYLSQALSYYLQQVPAESPVSLQKAQIQLDSDVWQSNLQLGRQVVEACADRDEDVRDSLEYGELIENGAVFLPGLSVLSETPAYFLRMLEDEGHSVRLLPIPNETGGLTMMPAVTAMVSAGCESTDAAAELLLFLLSETVQGSRILKESGGEAALFLTGSGWPVRKGCASKMPEHITMQPVQPGEISDTLRTDLEEMEERVDTCRLANSYDGKLYEYSKPYLYGEESWEACYARIETDWDYLDE